VIRSAAQHDAPVLEFLAHAAVRLTARDGTVLIIDPYVAGGFGGAMDFARIDEAADFVWTTHDHADHAAWDEVPGDPVVLEDAGRYGPFEVTTWTLAHDEYGGRRRGGMVETTRIGVDGRVVVHLSDVGQAAPGRIPTSFRRPDVLLATCGGFYTIGAAQAWEWSERIGARLTVPIHYKSDRCGLPIRPREHLEAHWRDVRREVGSRIELKDELFSFHRDVLPMAQRH
jgi:L-ascorbate metabolism protein UlaG (beta-lactamase superfamily)